MRRNSTQVSLTSSLQVSYDSVNMAFSLHLQIIILSNPVLLPTPEKLILICAHGVNSKKASRAEHDNTSYIFYWQEVDVRKKQLNYRIIHDAKVLACKEYFLPSRRVIDNSFITVYLFLVAQQMKQNTEKLFLRHL